MILLQKASGFSRMSTKFLADATREISVSAGCEGATAETSECPDRRVDVESVRIHGFGTR